MVSNAPSALNGSSSPTEESFETSLEKLHDIVTQLEAGDLTLDETIARFQEGSALAQHCLQLIDAAELRVFELTTEAASPADLE